MNYNQAMLNREFESRGTLADASVLECENQMQSKQSRHRQDAALGEASVYRFLRDNPFIRSRSALLQELRWLQGSEPLVPANVHDKGRFASSRLTLVDALLRRFEFPHPATESVNLV